jgi:hypothetical protein
MSDLSDDVEQAVLDALTDALPGPVTGLVGVVSYLMEDGEPGYVFFDMEDQRLNQSMGLARALGLFYDHEFTLYLSDPD